LAVGKVPEIAGKRCRPEDFEAICSDIAPLNRQLTTLAVRLKERTLMG
jgi:hypothetical protein